MGGIVKAEAWQQPTRRPAIVAAAPTIVAAAPTITVASIVAIRVAIRVAIPIGAAWP